MTLFLPIILKRALIGLEEGSGNGSGRTRITLGHLGPTAVSTAAS